MSSLVYLFVFGFLATATLGLLASWVDRKLTARIQYRIGPPILQPLNDVLKLMGKETLIPRGAAALTFVGAPMAALISVMAVSMLLWIAVLSPQFTFTGDVFVVVYLLLIPPVAIVVGGFASANPLASLGASRELKLLLSYELPFILAILVAVIQADFGIRLGDIVAAQTSGGVIAGSWSGALALFVALVCIQAKLALVPFDIPEAETEIAHGVLIEYSGPLLGIYRLTKSMLLFALPFFLIILYLGGVGGGVRVVYGVAEYLGLVVVLTLVRNTNPRLRVDQVVKFFWGPMTAVAAVAILLALGDY